MAPYRKLGYDFLSIASKVLAYIYQISNR